MKLQSLLVMVLCMFAGASAAQQAPHVCGAGPGPNEIMAGVQPAGPGVAPTPLCYWKSGAQQAAPQPTGYWEKTWGAIAGHSSRPILGAALGATSKDEAGRLAVADCKAKGGGEGCRLDITFYNQCAVLVTGNTIYNTARAESIERASQIGMEECAKKDLNCRVYYSACTEPIFHKY